MKTKLIADKTWLRQAAGISLVASGIALALDKRRRRLPLEGKVALITGGSRGLGLLLARELGRHGARVSICARDEVELARARRDLENRGIETHSQPCDISSFDEVQAFVDSTIQQFGRLDLVFNNAGNMFVGPLEAMGWEEFRSAMEVIFGGTVRVTLATLPVLKPGARLINISSIGGWVPVPHLLPYTAAKFAVTGFSQGLREELAQRGIYVTTVLPGLMRTGSFGQALFKGKREAELAWFSLGAALPGPSMSAARAARQIVEAARLGRPLITLSVPAKAARVLHGVFPGFTSRLLSLANGLLPDANPGAQEESAEPGKWHRRGLVSWLNPLLWLGDRAARKNNEGAAA